MKERWYLYGDDPELAEKLLLQDLEKADSPSERAWLLRHWPSLGGFSQAFTWLTAHEPGLLDEIDGRATLLRCLQHQRDRNPWLAMFPPQTKKRFVEFCHNTLAGDELIDIYLGGGLGDQLECLTLMADPALHPLRSRIRCHLPDSSKTAIGPLLQQIDFELIPACDFYQHFPGSLGGRPWFTWMGWLALVSEAGLIMRPQPLKVLKPNCHEPASLLFCWRSKVDPNDKHWAHLRSLPFVQILRIYSELVPWALHQGIRLIDITQYKPDEITALSVYQPTLHLIWPEIRSFSDTLKWMKASRGVVTIDTALVHLASWFGWPTLLLLHQFHDERWQNHQKGFDGARPLRVLAQERYNCWDALLPDLMSILEAWPWLGHNSHSATN